MIGVMSCARPVTRRQSRSTTILLLDGVRMLSRSFAALALLLATLGSSAFAQVADASRVASSRETMTLPHLLTRTQPTATSQLR